MREKWPDDWCFIHTLFKYPLKELRFLNGFSMFFQLLKRWHCCYLYYVFQFLLDILAGYCSHVSLTAPNQRCCFDEGSLFGSWFIWCGKPQHKPLFNGLHEPSSNCRSVIGFTNKNAGYVPSHSSWLKSIFVFELPHVCLKPIQTSTS